MSNLSDVIPPLHQVCRQIHRETAGMEFATNTFHLHVPKNCHQNLITALRLFVLSDDIESDNVRTVAVARLEVRSTTLLSGPMPYRCLKWVHVFTALHLVCCQMGTSDLRHAPCAKHLRNQQTQDLAPIPATPQLQDRVDTCVATVPTTRRQQCGTTAGTNTQGHDDLD